MREGAFLFCFFMGSAVGWVNMDERPIAIMAMAVKS